VDDDGGFVYDGIRYDLSLFCLSLVYGYYGAMSLFCLLFFGYDDLSLFSLLFFWL